MRSAPVLASMVVLLCCWMKAVYYGSAFPSEEVCGATFSQGSLRGTPGKVLGTRADLPMSRYEEGGCNRVGIFVDWLPPQSGGLGIGPLAVGCQG